MMLSLCKQIIWEWEISQGREQVPSKAIEENAAQVLKDALVKCGVFPGDRGNVEVLDRILDLLSTESCYGE